MAEHPTQNDEPNAERPPQVDPDLGFFQDSELYVVVLGAIFGAFATVALASLLVKSTPLMVATGLAGAYFGGIRLPCRIYGKRRLRFGFIRQLDELTTELNRALRGQLVETIGAVLWMGALGYFVQAWRAKNSEKLTEFAAILVLLPILAVVRRIVRSRLVSPSGTIALSAAVQVAPAGLQETRNRTELRHMTRIVFLFATANLVLAIGLISWELFTESITRGRSIGIVLQLSVAVIPSTLAFVGGIAMVKGEDWKRAMWGPKAVMTILWPLPIFSQVFGFVAYSKLKEPGLRELFASERQDLHSAATEFERHEVSGR